MEVHHHPDLSHKKKHVKEYFLEFLMIFVAVTLGFFAESLRENMTKKEKEKDVAIIKISNTIITHRGTTPLKSKTFFIS